MAKLSFLVLASASLALSACAPVGGEPGWDDEFGTWDLDDDGYLDDDEFGSAWGPTFDAWDEDDSGFLEEDEWDVDGVDFEAGDFTAWDYDGDGRLNEDEFVAGGFGAYDADADERIGRAEWGKVQEAR